MFGNLFAAHPQSVSIRRGPIYRAAYTYSPRICNPFRIHSRNVRNVFVFCMLHIRITKVWFLTCKSMVFDVQKGGFWVTKVWFLFFECCIVAIRSPRICGMFATLLQIVRHVVAIRLPRIRNLFATLLQSVCHAFAICLPRCCNLFATFSHLISSVVAICLQAKSLNLLCV